MQIAAPFHEQDPLANATDEVSDKTKLTPTALPLGLIVYLVSLVVLAGALWWRYRHDALLPMVGWRIVLSSVSNASCALLGCYLVLRRMSLLVDAISHAVLPGIVIVFLLTGSLDSGWMIVGAAAFGLLTSMLTHALSSTGEVAEDSSMGLVYTGLFALGVILINQYARQADLDPSCVLYGAIDLATVGIGSWQQIPSGFIRLAAVFLGVILFVGLCWKELKIVAFDPSLARAMGLPVMFTHYGLMALAAIVSVTSFEVVGSVLVVAMFIVPAATAQLLTDRLSIMLVWSVALAVGCALIGDLLASLTNTSLAGMMSVVTGIQLACAVFFSSRGGVVSRWWQNLRLSLRIEREDILAQLYRQEELPVEGGSTERTSVVTTSWLGWVASRQLKLSRALTDGARGMELTDSGRETARSIVRAHRLWETYLQKHFDLPPDHLHEPAERMEHFLTEQLQKQLAGELAGETHDPHGRAIPPTESSPTEKSP